MSLEYHFNKTFLKELSKIPEKQRIKIESFVFSEVRKYKTPEEIPNLGKLKDSTLFSSTHLIFAGCMLLPKPNYPHGFCIFFQGKYL
jgi:hypothetical protein